MSDRLFIVPTLLKGVGTINAAAKVMARQMGVDDPDEVWRRITSGEWVVSKVKPSPPSSVLGVTKNIITVPADLSLLERIALGKYDWKSREIAEHQFPHNIRTIGEWEYDLHHPNLVSSSGDAKSTAEVDGWIVAEVEHGLAFAAASPDEQRKGPIIFLGSVCKLGNSRSVIGLWGDRKGRSLHLNRWDGTWHKNCRFLRVRKVEPSAT